MTIDMTTGAPMMYVVAKGDFVPAECWVSEWSNCLNICGLFVL